MIGWRGIFILMPHLQYQIKFQKDQTFKIFFFSEGNQESIMRKLEHLNIAGWGGPMVAQWQCTQPGS